jgi:hypothetical protein
VRDLIDKSVKKFEKEEVILIQLEKSQTLRESRIFGEFQTCQKPTKKLVRASLM